MTYRDTLTELAASSETAVVELYRRLERGEITEAEFVALATAALARSNSRAAALAQLALAAYLTAALGRAVPVLALPPPDDTGRLRKAAQTLVTALATTSTPEAPATTPGPEARVARLGRAEPLTTAARTYSAGVAQSPHVTGWTRGMSPGACQLCQWWSRDGRVWPADHPMPTHKGCTCTQTPIVKETAR